MGNGYSRIPALWEQGVLRSTTRRAASAVGSLMESRDEVLLDESFRSMLTFERRRAERSRKPFVLMLLDASAFIEEKTSDLFMGRISSVLLKSTRETDLIGLYEKGVVLGVIFTEVSCESETPITDILRSKVLEALNGELGRKVAGDVAEHVTSALVDAQVLRRAVEAAVGEQPEQLRGERRVRPARTTDRVADAHDALGDAAARQRRLVHG